MMQNQQPYGQTYGQPYGQSYGQPIGQPYVQQPMQYGSPGQVLFGQQPPMYPGVPVNNTPGLYGPNPIIM